MNYGIDFKSQLKLRYVKMQFYATTFDRITKDKAAKFVDMLSAIGGTMGHWILNHQWSRTYVLCN